MARFGVIVLLEHHTKQPNKNPIFVSKRFTFHRLRYKIFVTVVDIKQGRHTVTLSNEHIWLYYKSPVFELYINRWVTYHNFVTDEFIESNGEIHDRKCRPETFAWFFNYMTKLKTTDIYTNMQSLINECNLRI